jgi:hypothetical protein
MLQPTSRPPPDVAGADRATAPPPRDRLTRGVLPLTLGVAMTLALAGYRFGESNHAVYLVDALRQNDPGLLANDWWTQSTLQYHFVFNRLSALLMRAGLIEPAFLAGYVGLAVLLHVAWRRLTLACGGDEDVYLASVILYHLMAAGTGLGVYHFLQNSAFLPSNVSNVAMLWGVYLWVRGRVAWSGLAFGVAGLFHLNHALAGIGLWIGLSALGTLRRRTHPSEGRRNSASPFAESASGRHWLGGTLLLVGLSQPAIAPAVKSVLSKTDALPLGEFVDLYVRLRHPHHYDPSTWPAALWLTFLLPVVVAVPAYRVATRQAPTPELRRAADAFALFLGMLVAALAGAGLWYVSEPLVQMSLYRFSIYPKLLSCVAAGWLLWRARRGPAGLRALVFAALLVFTAVIVVEATSGRVAARVPAFLRVNAVPLWLFALFATVALLRPRVLGWGRAAFGTLAAACVVVSLALSWGHLGIAHAGLRGDDPGYMELCAWARESTPADAVFVVPPDEQSFRLHARRAIVVNFKNVPQLSGELAEWRDRLEAVLDLDDVRTLAGTPERRRTFDETLTAIRDEYSTLPADHLAAVAARYGARYVVAIRRLDSPALPGPPVFSDSSGRYFLYDLGVR